MTEIATPDPKPWACVFARPGSSPRTVFGQRADGTLVHILDVVPSEDVACPDCGWALIAKSKSQKLVPHFAHKAHAECSSAGETALHKLAKDIIADAREFHLPGYPILLDGREVDRIDSSTVSFDAVEVERFENGLRPDLIGICKAQKDGRVVHRRLIIEIRVTHAVDARKLELLEQRGESVLEIDLSKTPRGLSEPELREEILKTGQREWLYHRRAEALEREAVERQRRMEEAREQRKAYAISAEEERERKRQTARRTPPTIASPLRPWAEDERRNWALIGMGDLFEVPADDGVFDVEAIVWRAKVWSALTPWPSQEADLSKTPKISDLARELAATLRSLGWVKPPFREPFTTFASRRSPPRDMVKEAVETLLTSGLSQHSHSIRPQYGDITTSFAEQRIKKAWTQYQEWKESLLALARLARARGVETYLLGTVIDDLPSIDRALSSATKSGSCAASTWDEASHVIATGKPRFGRTLTDKYLLAYDVEMSLPGDERPDRTARALDYITAQHRRHWQLELDAWTKKEVRRTYDGMTALKERLPAIDTLINTMGCPFLFSEEWVSKQVRRDMPADGGDPLKAAQEEVTKAADDVLTLRSDIERVERLGASCSRVDTKDLVVVTGIKIALGRRMGQERRHLKGLVNGSVLGSARAALSAIEEIGGRYGYPDDFACRALLSKPDGIAATLLELILGGFRVEYRKAVNELRTRRDLPKWIGR